MDKKKTTTKKKNPKPDMKGKSGKRGSGIDKAAAFAIFCERSEDGRVVTYADVAKRMGASRTAIQQMGTKGDWLKLRRELAETAILETTKTLGEQLREINESHLKAFQEVTNIGMDILAKEKRAYDKVVAMLDAGTTVKKTERRLAASRLMVAHQMVVDGVKGQRVALGLPTDVTKSLAYNFTFSDQLPADELKAMQAFVDKNYNNRVIVLKPNDTPSD